MLLNRPLLITMPKSFAILFILGISSFANAQKISLSVFARLLDRDIDEVNNYLITHNWDFDSNTDSVYTWVYKRDELNPRNAASWITVKFSDIKSESISFTFNNKYLYEIFYNELVRAKAHKGLTYNSKDGITIEYITNNHYLTFTTFTFSEYNSKFKVFIEKMIDFNKDMANTFKNQDELKSH